LLHGCELLLMASESWKPIFVLPNVDLIDAIECEIAAVVPATDQRVISLKTAHPKLKEFMGRFSDNFGGKFEPSLLLLREDAPEGFRDIEVLVSLRDLISISVVAYNRALRLLRRGGGQVLFGEAFAIYPWMVDNRYESLVTITHAMMAVHDVSKFGGQSSPDIFRSQLSELDLDRPLLAALMARWLSRYETPNPKSTDTALFRSLNMAYHASLLPAAIEATFYDVGRLIALWISAFEILGHPGGRRDVTLDGMFALLERTPWKLPKMISPDHETGSQKIKRPLASWLYHSLHQARNDFLHGNPVDRKRLLVAASERGLHEYAAPLYRLALTAFLPLVLSEDIPPLSEPEQFAAYLAESRSFDHYQGKAEKALLTAVQTPSD
jgi:hypothetical protein